MVWGFNANGSPDPTFGSNGATKIPVIEAGDKNFSTAIISDSQGNLYVGVSQEGQAPQYAEAAYIVGLTPTGQISPSFGNDGSVLLPSPSAVNSFAIDGAGRLLAAGSSNHRRSRPTSGRRLPQSTRWRTEP
jgi:hypothetical protein